MDPRPSDGFQPEWVAGFQRNYMNRLVSALRHIRARRRSHRAVKFAADLTLAMTARGTAWSRGILAQSRKNSPNFIDFIRSCGRPRIFFNKMKAVSGRHTGGRWKASDQWRTNFHRIRRNLHSIRRASSKSCTTGVKPAKLNASSKKSARRLLVAARRRSEVRTVDTRIQTLRSLVPGGRSMDTPALFQEAADYIVALKMQGFVSNSRTIKSRVWQIQIRSRRALQCPLGLQGLQDSRRMDTLALLNNSFGIEETDNIEERLKQMDRRGLLS